MIEFVDPQITPDGRIAVPIGKLNRPKEGEPDTLVLETRYQIGSFNEAGRFVPQETADEDPTWFNLSELIERACKEEVQRESAFAKGYAAGIRYAERDKRRPVDDGTPVVWRDAYNLLVVRNPVGRQFSHLQWHKTRGWEWVANMDTLPDTAVPLYDPSHAPQHLREMLDDDGVEVYPHAEEDPYGEYGHSEEHWYAKGLTSNREQNTDLTINEDLDTPTDPAKLEAAIVRAEKRLAALLDVRAALDEQADDEVEKLAEVILANTDANVDLDRTGARKVAQMVLSAYVVEER